MESTAVCALPALNYFFVIPVGMPPCACCPPGRRGGVRLLAGLFRLSGRGGGGVEEITCLSIHNVDSLGLVSLPNKEEMHFSAFLASMRKKIYITGAGLFRLSLMTSHRTSAVNDYYCSRF